MAVEMLTGGQIQAFYRSSTGEVQEGADGSEIQKALSDEQGLLWVDIAVRSPDAGRFLADNFTFHPLAIEDSVVERMDPAKIDDYGDYIFIVVQALNRYDPNVELEPAEVDIFLGPNYVVSCHRTDVPAISGFMERCKRNQQALAHGADWLLHALLDAIVDEYLPIVDALDETIDGLEERVLQRADGGIPQQIMMVRRNLLRVRRATLPQREIMNRLSRGEFPKLIRQEAAIYFRDIYDHLVRVEYLVESLRDLADGALNTYLSVVSNRLNEVMKVLTAAATVFLPLTLISGVYGMNFSHNQFPGFEEPWGFPVVAGTMVAIAVALLGYFRYRRWI